jgi:hypothetical protein
MQLVSKIFPNLQQLDIRTTAVTDEGIDYLLEGCPNLENLAVASCNLTTAGVISIFNFKKLKVLNIGNVKGKNLETISHIEALDESIVDKLSPLPLLQELLIHGTAAGPKFINFLTQTSPLLQSIVLTACQNISSQEVAGMHPYNRM